MKRCLNGHNVHGVQGGCQRSGAVLHTVIQQARLEQAEQSFDSLHSSPQDDFTDIYGNEALH